ncbi:MAG: metalloregulator ArsR/SmtB family transcription factor [Spirochaetales bacterium]|nr:metalloregulator ArsR/SmtB family transcription factor [Spirochaetales bacterium]
MKVLTVFKALADGTRLRLYYLLLHHELSVNEIVGLMEMGQSRISRHLKILTDSGLLTSRRDGLWIFYTAVKPENNQSIPDNLKDCMETDEELKSDYTLLKNKLNELYRQKTRYFDSHASDWDILKREIFGDLDISVEISSRLKKGSKIADLGCGNGNLLMRLKDKFAYAIGVDKSPGMLEAARKNLSRQDNNIELRLGEIEHLPIGNEEVDGVLFNMVLHYLPTPVQAILESARVVRQGGFLICVDLNNHKNEIMRTRFNHHWLGFDKKTLTYWLEKNGFKVKETVQFAASGGLKINLFYALRNINDKKEIKQ